ncbi:hypothetical protein [Phenylobacterium sp.]|uniref:hypothetical protein n=1 Tax=Phenylobacterium sp. TaxID=1871053 RepID=UPI001229F735|nr:hypothetical protein [Phenylobacterium sp.]THD58846.1 MAG: hypothetical protein E8A49_17795 [Phenylobacterium sp.]
MPMKTMLLAAATAASLLVPAAAMAQDWGRHGGGYEARSDRRFEDRRFAGDVRREVPAYGYGYGYSDYGYGYDAYPTYGYRDVRPVWHGGYDRHDGRHDRRF